MLTRHFVFCLYFLLSTDYVRGGRSTCNSVVQVQIQSLLHWRSQRLVHSWHTTCEMDRPLTVLATASIRDRLGLARDEQVVGAALSTLAFHRIFQVARLVQSLVITLPVGFPVGVTVRRNRGCSTETRHGSRRYWSDDRIRPTVLRTRLSYLGLFRLIVVLA